MFEVQVELPATTQYEAAVIDVQHEHSDKNRPILSECRLCRSPQNFCGQVLLLGRSDQEGDQVEHGGPEPVTKIAEKRGRSTSN